MLQPSSKTKTERKRSALPRWDAALRPTTATQTEYWTARQLMVCRIYESTSNHWSALETEIETVLQQTHAMKPRGSMPPRSPCNVCIYIILQTSIDGNLTHASQCAGNTLRLSQLFSGRTKGTPLVEYVGLLPQQQRPFVAALSPFLASHRPFPALLNKTGWVGVRGKKKDKKQIKPNHHHASFRFRRASTRLHTPTPQEGQVHVGKYSQVPKYS
ncbi:unnamed protein product [Ectocarpus fasciculatus]